jgi:uncharacterized membrane protein
MSQKPKKQNTSPAKSPEIREGSVERERSKPSGVVTTRSFQGPLPSPGLLREYEQVVPGLAAQIVDWTTSQTSHRQMMEKRAIAIDEKLSTWYIVEVILGLLLGFCVAGLVVWAVIELAKSNHEIAAGALGTIGFGSMVIAFITGRRRRVSEKKSSDSKPEK